MRRAIYPGSFDPVTFGHLDMIERAFGMVDQLIIGVLENPSKRPLFSVEERVKMLERVFLDYDHVTVKTFQGLTVDFAKKQKANLIIRGIRVVTDFEYELQMAHTNHQLAPEIETVFLTPHLDYSYVSSSIVKEVASFGGDVSRFIPETVAVQLRKKLKGV